MSAIHSITTSRFRFEIRNLTMKTIFVLLAFAALANADVEWSELHVKWSPSETYDNDSFYEIPFSKAAAEEDGWVSADGASSFSAVSTYCMPDDPRFCTHFDSYGNICGFQGGVLVSDIVDSGSPYDFSEKPVYTVKTIFGHETYASDVYTVDPEILKAGGRSDSGGVMGTEGVWIQNGEDSFTKISRDVAGAVDIGYIKEKCYDKMGVHYYYNMTSTMDCQDFFPWVVISNLDGEIHAMSFEGFGPAEGAYREWYEHPDAGVFPDIVYEYPPCLLDWGEKWGVISMHVYFYPKPWDFVCP